METRLKRFLSMAIAILMVVSMMPKNVVFAEDLSEEIKPDHVCDFAGVLGAVEATCTEDGERTLKCEGCGATKTEVIPALGHTYVDGKCECGEADPNYEAPHEHSYQYACSTECSTCENGTREASHTYVDGKCECGAEEPVPEPTEDEEVIKVQAMIDALATEVNSDEEAEALEAAIAAAADAAAELFTEQSAQLDYTNLSAAQAAVDAWYSEDHSKETLENDIETFAAAINNAESGGTVTLTTDLTIESDLNNAGSGYFNIPDGKALTIDLGGHTINVTDNSTGNFILFYVYGELTIKNGTINLTATNNRNWNAQSTIILNRGGVLNVQSGTYTHKGGTDMAFVLDNSGNYYGDATTNVYDGTTLSSTYTAIRNRMEQNSHGASGKATLNIHGGSISGSTSAIWAQAASTSTTAPATGEINISGGNVGLINTARSDGAQCMTTISGGTVTGFKGEVGELKVTGGTLTGNVTILTASGEASDYKVDSDGVYQPANYVAQIGDAKYESLSAAIAVGGEVKVLKEVTENSVITVTKDMVLDLNSNTVSLHQLKINSGVTVEVKNGTMVGTSASYDTIRSEGGNLTLTNVNVSGLRHTVRIISGEATITGGTYTYGGQNRAGVTLNVINVGDDEKPTTNVANVTIDGGTFIGPKGYLSDGGQTVKVQKGSSVTITGGNFSKGLPKTLNADNGATLSITGGTYDQDPSAYVAEGYVYCYNADTSSFIVGELPEAEVTNLTENGPVTIKAGEYSIYNGSLVSGTEDLSLPIALQFTAKDTGEEAKANAFGYWNTDFYISLTGVEGEIDLSGCYLVGDYGSFGTIAIPLDGAEISGGTVYPVLGTMITDWFEYWEICADVQTFKCGIYLTESVLTNNENLNVNLELRIAPHTIAVGSNDSNYIQIGNTYSYDVDDLTLKNYVAQIGEKKYETLAKAIEAADGSEPIKLLKAVTLTECLAVDKAVTIDLNGNNISGSFASSYGMIYVKKGASLTITGTGTITSSAASAIGNYGTVAINGGTITADNGAALYNFNYLSRNDFYGTATIDGGEVDEVWNSGVLTVKSGSVTYLDNSGALTIEGGTVNEIIARDGTDASTVTESGKITITNGNIGTINEYDEEESDTEGKTAQIIISGGIFGQAVPEAYCAPNYVPVDNGNGTYGVKQDFTSILDMSAFANDSSKTIKAGAEIYVDGEFYTLTNDLTVEIPNAQAKKSAMLVTTYDYEGVSNGAIYEGAYPTAMYVWLVKGATDPDQDGTFETFTVERISALDNFFKYEGTSIRVGSAKNGIRFFTSVNANDADKLINGKLITSGSLAGAKMTSAGTEFWKTVGKEQRSEVYGSKAGSSFRVFQTANGRNWFTGVLTGLDTDAQTITDGINTRPYAELKLADGTTLTLYGGTLNRSIYYVAVQNKDYFAAGSAHDNFVEGLISKGNSIREEG